MKIMVDLNDVRVRKAMNTAGSGVTIACSKCGHSNSGRARFCEKCAAPMSLIDDQPTIANTRLASPLQLGDADASRYSIAETLGEGGMGAVYKAWDHKLERFVAIKVIHQQLARSEEALRRFKQELLLTQKIAHKNIVRIFDFGDSGETK